MKLYFSPASPFVRKVLVCAHELGLADRIGHLTCAVNVIKRDAEVVSRNPLGQVPTLLLDDGTALHDSRVICEYLDHIGGGTLFPAPGPQRWRALVEQSVADGLLDAAILGRQEMSLRPPERRFEPWRDAQMAKIVSALDHMLAGADRLSGRIDIGTIATGCALGYLDFRYPDFAWRDGRATLADWFDAISLRPAFERTALAQRPAA